MDTLPKFESMAITGRDRSGQSIYKSTTFGEYSDIFKNNTRNSVSSSPSNTTISFKNFGKGTLCLNDDPTKANSRQHQIIKFFILLLIPSVALAALTTAEMISDIIKQDNAAKIQHDVLKSVQFGNLIHSLQIERDYTVLYVDSNFTRSTFKMVLQKRLFVTKILKEIHPWPVSQPPVSFLINSTIFQDYLTRHRDTVVDQYNTNTTALDELKFYSNVIDKILRWIIDRIYIGKNDKLWNHLVAYRLLLNGIERIGMERALGSMYFTNYALKDEEIALYYARLQIGRSNINSARQYSKLVDDLFHNYIYQMANSSYEQIQLYRNMIISNILHTASLSKANDWFDNITHYIDQLYHIQQDLADFIVAQSNSISRNATSAFIISTTVLVSTIIICPIILYLTIKLTQQNQLFATQAATQTHMFLRERRKNDGLLIEMLPKSVVRQLKEGKYVNAEAFDNATLYFSDIADFTKICYQSTAMEIIEMLNHLYIQLDTRIENYNVYKVETIGDDYMVASGLPDRLPRNQHVIEIANMALDLLETVSNMKAPHDSNLKIHLRIGIHTGYQIGYSNTFQ